MRKLIQFTLLTFGIFMLMTSLVTMNSYAEPPIGKPQACDPNNPGKAIGNKHCEGTGETSQLTACDTSGQKDEDGTPIDTNPDGKIDQWELLDHQNIGATLENIQTWISISEDNVNHNDSINGFIDTNSEVNQLNNLLTTIGIDPCI